MANPREQLRDDLYDIIVTGIAENIRQTEEAMMLQAEITANAAGIREAGFGHLFGRAQVILGRYAVLAVCRLFDPEDDGYPLRSIPAALNYLRFHADYLEITGKETIIKKLVSFGHDPAQFEGVPDPWITQLLRKEYADRLPDARDSKTSDLGKALSDLKHKRDIFSIDFATEQGRDNPKETERNIKILLVYAMDFVETVGRGYLNTDFKPDTSRLQSELREFLSRVGIGR